MPSAAQQSAIRASAVRPRRFAGLAAGKLKQFLDRAQPDRMRWRLQREVCQLLDRIGGKILRDRAQFACIRLHGSGVHERVAELSGRGFSIIFGRHEFPFRSNRHSTTWLREKGKDLLHVQQVLDKGE